ncbi:cytochrome ubiquinol oxidase subunit I [Candidatus Saccharibacteria bacterium]|nr:MAG: cytochrome ubiquinol oxidase subunit I [Candidatus Saccharibacteria bacterium]
MSLDTDAARALMADSLGFHIIFAMLGVGLPLVILLIEQLGLKRKDPLILEHAKRLSYATIILVVAGVASGTIISIQMSLMWGNLIHFGGKIMGLAFGWEGYAFMLEAVFLAFYVTTWGKIKGWKHWLIGVPVAIGSFGSAFAITLGNAWMQHPGKLHIVNGVVQSDNPLSALLTKTAFFMVSHSVAGYYLATILCILGIYAFYCLRFKPTGKDQTAVRQIMFRLAATAVVFIGITAGLGHFQTQYLADSEPRKLAALELNEETRTHAPYIIGGEWKEDGTVEGGIRVPNMLSILAGNSPNKEVRGLQDFPRDTWPMLFINTLFEAKLLIVGIVSVITILFTALHFPKLKNTYKDLKYKKPLLLALLSLGPLTILIVELGWMVAEFGRQPFVVNGYMRTEDAFSGKIGTWGYIFPILFLALFVVTGFALWLLFKKKGKIKPVKGVL